MGSKSQHGTIFVLLVVVLCVLWLGSSTYVSKIGAQVSMSGMLNDKHDGKDAAIFNPGCISKKLKDYKPSEISRVYHHPDIVHYVMLSPKPQYQLIFHDYISILSVYNLLKPERITLHTNADITGAYWKSVQAWKGTKVDINRVERVAKLSNLKVGNINHEADYTKIKILYDIGGTILDFDVIMVNGTKWRQNQKTSECVLSLEGDKLNIGALSCIKGSSFAKKWLNKYHTDYRTGWLYNSGEVPGHILKISDTYNTCYNVYVDETIAPEAVNNKVIVWVDNKHSVNWREKSAAHYFYTSLTLYTPLKKEDMDERLIAQDTSLGELFRHVLDAR